MCFVRLPYKQLHNYTLFIIKTKLFNDEHITNQLYLDCWVYTTFYLYLCVFYICLISYKHVKLNWHEMPTKKKITWKIFGETWYRTRVVAAKTKPLYPLAYRVLTQYTLLVYLIYVPNINLRFRCSCWFLICFYIYMEYGAARVK